MSQQGRRRAGSSDGVAPVSLFARVSDLGATPVSAPVDCVVVTGPDAEAFLQGQLSQDLGSMKVGSSSSTLLLEPDGHLGWILQVVRAEEERFYLLGASGRARSGSMSEILERLKRFKIRVRAELEIVPASRSTTVGAISLGERWSGIEEFLELGIVASGPDHLDERCLHAGVITPSLGLDGLTPLGLGTAVIEQSVSFSKGCYTGQELVARMDARVAAPPQRLARLEAVGALDSDEVVLDGVEGARVLAAIFDEATQSLGGLVEVPRRVDLEGGLAIRIGGVTGTLRQLP